MHHQKPGLYTVLQTEISDAAAIAKFGGTGMNIFEYAPKVPAARLYKKLTKEVGECLAQGTAVLA
jgi:cellulose biosynthesis protein BcsQ